MNQPTKRPPELEPGDLCRLPFGGEGLVGWTLLKRHPDDAQTFLCVPVDAESAIAGDHDLVLAPGERDLLLAAGDGQLVLRCEHSVWLQADDFWERVAEQHIARTDRVKAIELVRRVAGLETTVECAGTVEFDECHAEWKDATLRPATVAAERWRDRRVVHMRSNESVVPAAPPVVQGEFGRGPVRLPLAASGRGAFHAAWKAARDLEPRSLDVDVPGGDSSGGDKPGGADGWSIWVDPVGVQPFAHEATVERDGWVWPEGGRRRRVQWGGESAASFALQSLAWGAGRVRFAFDGDRPLELLLESDEPESRPSDVGDLEDQRNSANPGEFLDYVRLQLGKDGVQSTQIDLRVRAAANVLSRTELILAPGDRLAYDVPLRTPPRSGVVGLVVDPRTDPPLGLVTRLVVEPAQDWHVDRELPFDAHRLQDVLARLLRSSGVQHACALPERFAFEVRCERVGEMQGPSMDVAALLAMLDGLDGHRHPILRAACSVVQEQCTDAADGALVAVEHADAKLEAFRREIGLGSLLVCSADTDPDSIDPGDARGFSTVWRVASWDDLARKLDDAGLLGPLLASHRLDAREHRRVVDRLRALCATEQRYREALDLAQRFEQCDVAEDVPVAQRWLALQRCSDPARLLGLAELALAGNRRLVDRIHAAGDLASYEERADADNHLASALFEAHEFEESRAMLSPWIERLDRDPGLLTSSLRARLYTVAARAASVLGDDHAATWMTTAVTLQERANDPFLPRTAGHLVEVLLRLGRDEDARTALDRAFDLQRSVASNGEIGSWFLAMYRAELARRTGTQWSDSELDDPELARDGQSAWALAGYHQAVARQVGRTDDERITRLRTASDLAGRGALPGSVYDLLARVLARCAATLADATPTRTSDASLRDLADRDTALGRHYGAAAAALDASGDFASVDRLLARIPHFAGPAQDLD